MQSDKNIPKTWPKSRLKRQSQARIKAKKRNLRMACCYDARSGHSYLANYYKMFRT